MEALYQDLYQVYLLKRTVKGIKYLIEPMMEMIMQKCHGSMWIKQPPLYEFFKELESDPGSMTFAEFESLCKRYVIDLDEVKDTQGAEPQIGVVPKIYKPSYVFSFVID